MRYGVESNAVRDVRVTAKPSGGILRQGNRRSLQSFGERAELHETTIFVDGFLRDVESRTLDEKRPTVVSARPIVGEFRDEDRRQRPATVSGICPGCGILRPKVRRGFLPCADCCPQLDPKTPIVLPKRPKSTRQPKTATAGRRGVPGSRFR